MALAKSGGEAGHARRTPFVFIGNNEYTMTGLSIGARKALDCGTLSLYMAQRPGRLVSITMRWPSRAASRTL